MRPGVARESCAARGPSTRVRPICGALLGWAGVTLLSRVLKEQELEDKGCVAFLGKGSYLAS